MVDCDHHKYTIKKNIKKFKEYIFEYEAETCNNCKATLWSQDTEVKYDNWLQNLQEKDPTIFQICIPTSLLCISVLAHISKELNISKEKLVFKILRFYEYNKISPNLEITYDNQIHFEFSSKEYRDLESLSQLSGTDKQIILDMICKISKIIIDRPELYDLFKSFCF